MNRFSMNSMGAPLPALCAVALSSLPALAQERPLQTAYGSTLPAGSMVLSVGADYMRDEPNFHTGHERDRWSGPDMRLLMAPSEGVELDFSWVALTGVIHDPDTGNTRDWGDVTIGTKVGCGSFFDRRVDLAARWVVSLPETESGEALGPNTLRFLAQAVSSVDLEPVSVHLNAGLAIHDQVTVAGRQDDFLAYGVALEWRVNRGFVALAEVHGLMGEGTTGTEEHSEARLGFRADALGTAWDIAARRGMERADGSWGITMGCSWTVGQRRR